MNDFPWDDIYNIFAEPFVEDGLEAEVITAQMYALHLVDNKVSRIAALPVAHFFTGPAGKEKLGEIIRLAFEAAADAPFCLVLIAEAYMRIAMKPTDELIEKIENSSLKDDPEATECIMINIMRRGENRIGMLPILPDRSVRFSPLTPLGVGGGRFSAAGTDEGFRDFVKRHQGGKQ